MKRRARAGAIAVALGAVTAGAAAAWAAREVPAAMGGDPTRGARGERVRTSPRYRDGVFHNPPAPERPAESGRGRTILRELLLGKQLRHPSRPIPVVRGVAGEAEADPALAVTWFGHSTALLEIEGQRLLLDPVWSERCSPSQSVGPRRMHQPPLDIEELPRIDAVLISHDHYDHLDMHSVRTIARTQPHTRFLVPLGVGAHLERWGVDLARVDELDWEEQAQIGALRVVCTSAHHFSGRGFANNGTLWSSWAVIGAEHRVFYSGDSGYFDGFAATGKALGPFDLTLVQIGAYSEHWQDIHMTPEEGVSTHLDVRGGLMVPVHWCTFVLGLHDWSEPVLRLCADADARGVQVAVPRPGERIEVARPPKLDHWWRAVV
jgi:L-ascorbate metabolism protein UlaG (beta-lactamase superfamily)